jgi:predicted Holliday junction resolvase-like endonuclease
MATESQFILSLVVAAALLLIVAILILWQADRRRLQSRHDDLIEKLASTVQAARRDSVDKSRSTLKGRIAEQFAPVLPGFPYEPSDARFLGNPIDYIVFAGLGDDLEDTTSMRVFDIILLEVKHASSALTPTQKAIARSIQEGRVRFEISRIDEEGKVSLESWTPRKTRASSSLGSA